MKRMRTIFLAGLVATAAAGPARADGFGWGLLFGALVAAPIVSSAYYPHYYYPPYAYAPYYGYAPTYAYAAPTYSVPVYSAPAASAPVNVWYFCASSNSYYPYTRACPEGWQSVPTTPPG